MGPLRPIKLDNTHSKTDLCHQTILTPYSLFLLRLYIVITGILHKELHYVCHTIILNNSHQHICLDNHSYLKLYLRQKTNMFVKVKVKVTLIQPMYANDSLFCFKNNHLPCLPKKSFNFYLQRHFKDGCLIVRSTASNYKFPQSGFIFNQTYIICLYQG